MRKQATKTGSVAQAVIAKTGCGSWVYNDKLKDGRRSLKVQLWDEQHYRMAKAELEAQGCTVEWRVVKKKQLAYPDFGPGIRLIVAEQ